MTDPNGDKPRNDRFLDAFVEELRSMSDTDALEGENAEELVKLGESLLRRAREDAGKLRMADAKCKLSVVAKTRTTSASPSVAEAKRYLESHRHLTLAARGLNELSDEDVLDLFTQAKSLEEASGNGPKGSKE